MLKKTVLVLGNPLNHEGGVVEFNRGLIKTINSLESEFVLEPFSIGSRMYLFYYPLLKRLLYPLYFLFDLFKLFFRMCQKDIKVIQVNPSLIPVPLIRDGVIVFLAKVFLRKKIVVVVHGWKEDFFIKITKIKLLKKLVVMFFYSADSVFVLSDEFKQKLISLGVKCEKINVVTTFFYKEDICVGNLKSDSKNVIKFLFLGRVSELKGITELICALRELASRHQHFQCDIVGHGDKPGVIQHYQKLVDSFNLSSKVNFLGRITGHDKFNIYADSDIYIFPSYTEGCPTSVIEALASGMFVISTNVGALDDIIDSSNGIKVGVKDVEGLVSALETAIANIEIIRKSRGKITELSFSKYEVSFVADRFMKTYLKY